MITVLHQYNYPTDESIVRSLAAGDLWAEAFDTLAPPLHEALYKAQSFELLQTMTPAEEFILCLDYIQMQIGQGGFIQLIQNGYISLLVNVIESAQRLNIALQLQQVLDDALKIFVLNKDALGRETTPKEFAALYQEFAEFEPLDKQFAELLPAATKEIVQYVLKKD